MNAFEQLRAWRGDVEVEQPPPVTRVLRWGLKARSFCDQCEETPLFLMHGEGLSGKTRSRAIIDKGLKRGVVERIEQVHCPRCPAAEPLLQIGVLDLLLRFPSGPAWCLHYAHQLPGAPEPDLQGRRGRGYGRSWLHPTVLDWLTTHVERWQWPIAKWHGDMLEVTSLPTHRVQRSAGELVLTLGSRYGKIRWVPGVTASVDRYFTWNAVFLRPLERYNEASGDLLAIDLWASSEERTRVLGMILLEDEAIGG